MFKQIALALYLCALFALAACSQAVETSTPAASGPTLVPGTASAGQALTPAPPPTSIPRSLTPNAGSTVIPLPDLSNAGGTTPAATGGAAFALTSSAFAEGTNIPRKYTCDAGSNPPSPDLKWSKAPAGVKGYALIMEDPDAPSGTFVHWVLYDIPGTATSLAEGEKAVGQAGRNGAGRNAYAGPCPPNGTHRYFFSLYALDTASLNLPTTSTRDQLLAVIKPHALTQAVLMGRYSR